MRYTLFLLLACAAAGCAAHRPQAAVGGSLPLETFIEQVRHLSTAVRPTPQGSSPPTIEQTDPELKAAQLALTLAPGADNHKRVAAAYARLGVLDAAYSHYAAASHIDPRDAGAFDGLARVWRDWGFPHLGLGDAYRAIYFAPDSPVPQNTLGTLLVRLGQPGAARAAFERALARAPGAPYVLNNLCYASLEDGDRSDTIDRCRAAVNADPTLATARNNLALAYAASGDYAAASREFLLAGDRVSERYNMGVALFATGQFEDAAAAFDEAAMLRPSLSIARERARQARAAVRQ